MDKKEKEFEVEGKEQETGLVPVDKVDGDTEIQDSFTDQLMCDLTTEEIIAVSKMMAESMEELTLAEKAFDDAKQQHKARISQIEANVQLQASLVRSGKELRGIKCHWELDFSENKKSLIREDTGEIIKTIPLEAHDRQKEMKITDEQATN